MESHEDGDAQLPDYLGDYLGAVCGLLLVVHEEA